MKDYVHFMSHKRSFETTLAVEKKSKAKVRKVDNKSVVWKCEFEAYRHKTK